MVATHWDSITAVRVFVEGLQWIPTYIGFGVDIRLLRDLKVELEIGCVLCKRLLIKQNGAP